MSETSLTEPAPPAAPRRRYLTVLFSDLSDSTKIAGRLEAEDYCDLLEHLRSLYHQVVEAHEGVIAQISGDGMLAIFGYPETREGDGRRAVEAALDLHEALEALSGEARWGGAALRLHTGIHSGLVLVHPGDQVRGRFELPGTTTSIASRLCSLAGPGQILVSEATLGPERHLFHASERSHLRLRGKDQSVPTLAILGRASIRTRYAASVRGGLTPFVGRGAELARLKRSLDEAIAGAIRFVEIEGPPGVGKTRLADEVLRHAADRGCRVHRGECDAAAEPLQPFLQIAKSIFGLNRPIPKKHGAKLVEAGLSEIDPALLVHKPALLRLLSLSGAEAASGAGRASGHGATVALRGLFEGLAKQGPLILFVDDWHSADDASREVLAVLRGLESESIFILATARPLPPGDRRIGEFDVLALAPFSEDETIEAVTRLLPSPDPFVIDDVRASSGGNALFIEELCHAIAAGRADEGPHGGSPWLDNLIESRFARLPEPQADLVRAAAVIGNVIPSWLLEAITGHGEDDPLVAELSEQDFIFRGEREGTLRFKHGITRDTIYDSVGLHRRRALHLQIAETLRSRGAEYGEEEPHEALAYHYGAGEDVAATAHHAELAGDKALAASALDRAQAQYKAALAALDRLPASDENSYRWGRIAQRLGLAAVFDPSRDQIPLFERAVERAALRRDRAAIAWAEYWLGYINYALGEPGAAIVHCERALRAAVDVKDDPLAVQIRATLGQAKAAACDYDGALSLLDEAIEVKRRHRTGAKLPIGFAYSLSCKAFALGDMGRFDEAHAGFAEAMTAIGDTQHEVRASVLNQHSAVCLWQGRMEQAMELAAEAERIGERVRSLYAFAMSRALGNYARWRLQGDAEAVQAMDEATSWLEAGGRGQFTSLNYGWLAEAMVQAGRLAEARRYAENALLRAAKHDRLGEAMAWRALARVAARDPAGEPPAYYLERAMAAAAARQSRHETAVTRLCEAELAFAAGDRRAAAAPLAEATLAFAAMAMPLFAREAERLAALMTS